jgi:ribosome maturation factor RimP
VLSKDLFEKLEKKIDEIASQEGCKLYDFDFIGSSQGRVLRVFIDKEGPGVSINDCSNVSKGISAFLDIEDLIPEGEYNLEVSSPGIERILKKNWHYTSVIGKNIFLKLKEPLASFAVEDKRWIKSKNFEALLKTVDNDFLILELEPGVNTRIPMSAIEKAKLVFEVPGAKPHKK